MYCYFETLIDIQIFNFHYVEFNEIYSNDPLAQEIYNLNISFEF